MKIKYQDIEYSLYGFAKKFNRSYIAFFNFIKRNYTEEIIDLDNDIKSHNHIIDYMNYILWQKRAFKNKKSTAIWYNGDYSPSIHRFCEKYNCSFTSLKRKLEGVYDLTKDEITIGLHSRAGKYIQGKKIKNIEVRLFNRYFDNLQAFCNFYDFKYTTLNKYCKRNNNKLDINKLLKYEHNIKFDQDYNNFYAREKMIQLCQHYDLTEQQLKKQMELCKIDIYEAGRRLQNNYGY